MKKPNYCKGVAILQRCDGSVIKIAYSGTPCICKCRGCFYVSEKYTPWDRSNSLWGRDVGRLLVGIGVYEILYRFGRHCGRCLGGAEKIMTYTCPSLHRLLQISDKE